MGRGRLNVFRSALAPLSVGIETCTDTNYPKPAASATAMSGTSPADAIKFGSSNAALIAAGVRDSYTRGCPSLLLEVDRR